MTSLFSSPWFYWALGVAVALPTLLVVLTEVEHVLSRRSSPLVRPLHLTRVYIVPLAALLVLLVKASEVSIEATPVRVIATALGFVVLVLLLSGMNATLFQSAPEGSWRKRIPSIFLDVARVLLIVLGVGLIFSFVWGANVGGLFAALGVTSIVIGLALQNAVGQIVSGLLMLFEQPFELGDWLDTPAGRGQVREVNWRSVHIDTGDGLTITPNSVLAGASFTNLSRPTGVPHITVETAFAVSDPPDHVTALLRTVAGRLPQRHLAVEPTVVPLGAGRYRTSIPLRSPADDPAAGATFLRWLWYAARRAALHLDGAADDPGTEQQRWDAITEGTRSLRLTRADQRWLLDRARLVRYGAEELIEAAGSTPDSMRFVVAGQVMLQTAVEDVHLGVRVLQVGDLLGQTSLTREPVAARAIALDEVTMLEVDREDLEELVAGRPAMLHQIGQIIDRRRHELRQAVRAQTEVN